MKTKWISLILMLSALLGLAGCAKLGPELGNMGGLIITEAKIELQGKEAIRRWPTPCSFPTRPARISCWTGYPPETGDIFGVMIGERSLLVKMGTLIPAGGRLKVKGSFPIRTNNIPRSRLDEMGSLISGFKISSRQVLNIPGQPTQTNVPTLTAKPTSKTPTLAANGAKISPTPTPKGKTPVKATKTQKP